MLWFSAGDETKGNKQMLQASCQPSWVRSPWEARQPPKELGLGVSRGRSSTNPGQGGQGSHPLRRGSTFSPVVAVHGWEGARKLAVPFWLCVTLVKVASLTESQSPRLHPGVTILIPQGGVGI